MEEPLSYTVQDKKKKEFLIELSEIDPLKSLQLRKCSTFLTEAYLPIELEFAQKFPEALAQDKFLNCIANVTDWKVAENKLRDVFLHFFDSGFAKGLSDNRTFSLNFTHLIAVAKDKETKQSFGFIYYFVTKENQSQARVPIFGIDPKYQNSGIGKLLMNSIFVKHPNIKKIELSTRMTNKQALCSYKNWGFEITAKSSPHWVNLEYDLL